MDREQSRQERIGTTLRAAPLGRMPRAKGRAAGPRDRRGEGELHLVAVPVQHRGGYGRTDVGLHTAQAAQGLADQLTLPVDLPGVVHVQPVAPAAKAEMRAARRPEIGGLLKHLQGLCPGMPGFAERDLGPKASAWEGSLHEHGQTVHPAQTIPPRTGFSMSSTTSRPACRLDEQPRRSGAIA